MTIGSNSTARVSKRPLISQPLAYARGAVPALDVLIISGPEKTKRECKSEGLKRQAYLALKGEEWLLASCDGVEA